MGVAVIQVCGDGLLRIGHSSVTVASSNNVSTQANRERSSKPIDITTIDSPMASRIRSTTFRLRWSKLLVSKWLDCHSGVSLETNVVTSSCAPTPNRASPEDAMREPQSGMEQVADTRASARPRMRYRPKVPNTLCEDLLAGIRVTLRRIIRCRRSIDKAANGPGESFAILLQLGFANADDLRKLIAVQGVFDGHLA